MDSSSSYTTPLLFLSGGMFLFYLTSKLSKGESQIDDAKDDKSNSVASSAGDVGNLFEELLPFSFIPENTPTGTMNGKKEIVAVNLETWKSLSKVLASDTEGNVSLKLIDQALRDAVLEQMLVHKLHRLLIEKPKDRLSNQEAHIALWLLLKCVLVVGSDAIDVILRVFDVEQLLLYVDLKPVHQQRLAVFGSPGIGASLEANTMFEWDTEVVWLAFALVAQLIIATAPPLERGESLHAILQHNSDLQVMRENKSLMSNLVVEAVTPRATHTQWRLDSSVGRQLLNDLFKIHLVHLLLCDHTPLTELALNTMAQMIACLPPRLWHPLKMENLLLRMMLLQQEPMLLLVARCLTTAFLLSHEFTGRMLRQQVEEVSFVNEMIELSLVQQDMPAVQIQFMNVLYLCVLQSPRFANTLLTGDLRMLDRVTKMSQKVGIDLNFVSLQLIFGLSTHAPLHDALITNKKLLSAVQQISFSPHMLLRHYCLLIWIQLVGPRSSPQIVSHLCRTGRLINLLMLRLREEREIRLKLLVIQCIKFVIMPKSHHHERMLLVDHFNLLFELFDLWKFYISYLVKYQAVYGSQVSDYVHQCIETCRRIYSVLLVLVQSPQQLGERIKQTLKEQYDVDSFVEQMTTILKGWPRYDRLVESIEQSAHEILDYRSEDKEVVDGTV